MERRSDFWVATGILVVAYLFLVVLTLGVAGYVIGAK